MFSDKLRKDKVNCNSTKRITRLKRDQMMEQPTTCKISQQWSTKHTLNDSRRNHRATALQ